MYTKLLTYQLDTEDGDNSDFMSEIFISHYSELLQLLLSVLEVNIYFHLFDRIYIFESIYGNVNISI